MTDAQIKLYAALRVAVPGEWRISGHSYRLDGPRSAGNQVVYFSRPVFVLPTPRERYYGVGDVPQQVGIEKLAIACDWDSLERNTAEVVRNMVWEAEDLMKAAGSATR